MSISSIQNNLAARVKKAYNADTSPVTTSPAATSTKPLANQEKETVKAAVVSPKDNLTSASALVTLSEKTLSEKTLSETTLSETTLGETTLGGTANRTEIYTAKGLLQHMHKLQLSNTNLPLVDDKNSNHEHSDSQAIASANTPELENVN